MDFLNSENRLDHGSINQSEINENKSDENIHCISKN